jgi:hypothetical protein
MKQNAGKDPSFQFYWKDWLSDTKLKLVSKRVKGLWMDLICISCDMPVPGVFHNTNSALTRQQLAVISAGSTRENLYDVGILIDLEILKKFGPDQYDGAFYVPRI